MSHSSVDWNTFLIYQFLINLWNVGVHLRSVLWEYLILRKQGKLEGGIYPRGGTYNRMYFFVYR